MSPYFSRSSVLSLLASSLYCVGTTEAFVPWHALSSSVSSTNIRLCGMTPRNSSGDQHEEESFDADAARQKLKQLFREGNGGEGGSPGKRITSVQDLLQVVRNDEIAIALMEQNFPPPPLTASDRDRRQSEIQVLQQLKERDDPATRTLWNLWFSERGGKAKKLLEKADNCMNQPDLWNACEKILIDLIAEHGPYFTEPINRLATLYYLRGKFKQSYALCLLVLHNKPWHFGALSGIVMVSLARNDKDKARYWAERRLPTLAANQSIAPFAVSNAADDGGGPTNNPRRLEWVERAVRQAQEALDQAEERTAKSLGQPEDYYKGQKRGEGGDSSATQKDDSDWQ